MKEIEFRDWLNENNKNKKVIGDCVYRLKRIEREFDHCDLDIEYHNDRCQFLMDAFKNKGENENMKKYPNVEFPIGKYYMSTYRYALKQYIEFLDETILNKK